MARAYLRLDPRVYEKKVIQQGYPLPLFAAFVALLCEAESQPERGYFRSERVLRASLEPADRLVPELIRRGDVVVLEDGRIYADGWNEWQEGDLQVRDRINLIRGRRGSEAGGDASSGARRTANWRLRTRVFERDGHTCRYCGIADYPRQWLVLEHVDPAGGDDEANLVTACRSCNKLKGGRTPDQAGMPFGAVPVSDTSLASARYALRLSHGDTSQEASDVSPTGERDASHRTDGSDESPRQSVIDSRSGKQKKSPVAKGYKLDDEGPLLTADQLSAWSSFGSEWDAFKIAWLDRGLKLPPSGEPDEDGSQRATLHPIVDDWPNDVAGWVRSAPKGASGRDVVGHVIRCYREATADVAVSTPEWLAGPSKAEAAETVGAIIGRMAS